MDTVHVDICYRPLRVAWAIRANDMEAFRTAARVSFALWGGRFNPIVVVDHEQQAESLIDVFRVDAIFTIGDSEAVKTFPNKFAHLINPFFHDSVFVGNSEEDTYSQILDLYNTLMHLRDKQEWAKIKERGLRLYAWQPDDPLADVFLMQFGEYPRVDEVHIDYRASFKEAGEAKEIAIDPVSKLAADIFEYPSISFISRYGIESHQRGRGGWDTPGFFSGDASNFEDLVCFWNLRAADIPLLFVDVRYLDRYGDTVAAWGKAMHSMVAHRHHEFDRHIGVWVREERLDSSDMTKAMTDATKPFGGQVATVCVIWDHAGNGLNVRPPVMQFGTVSTLGVVSTELGKPKVSFSLDRKPFSDDLWFHRQTLVASLSFRGGLDVDEEHILVPPFVPELNEFFGRAMHFRRNKVRSEFDGIGLVIDACDTTGFIYALPVSELFDRIFDLAGFSTKLSNGGLIARQLITQLGGVDGARAFKIPGVRRLLKMHGPKEEFTKKSALQLIGCKDPENPSASFKDYEELYGDHHPFGTKLNPQVVFSYLVEKGMFRIGAKLVCPNCRLSSWTALDVLKQRLVCEMCGREFDATSQLVNGEWHYRRSGVLGAEKNAQGAIPVVLTLQQFKVNLHELMRSGMYSPSLDLIPKGGTNLPKCEVDFVWLVPQNYHQKTVIIIGECKDRGKGDQGKDKGTIDATDIDHLKRVADAIPRKRFETYIVLAKLCPFTPEEIALAKTLNDTYRRRAILLTARELEPYHFYERTKLEFKNIIEHASSPEDLAINTARMYFTGNAGGE